MDLVRDSSGGVVPKPTEKQRAKVLYILAGDGLSWRKGLVFNICLLLSLLWSGLRVDLCERSIHRHCGDARRAVLAGWGRERHTSARRASTLTEA